VGRQNNKKAADKRIPLAQAVETYVTPGDTIVFGGMGGAQCVAHTYEIIRQKITDLTLIGDSPCEPGDMLMGAGALKRAEIAWCGYAVAGLGHNYRRIAEQKIPHEMELEEYSNFGTGLRLLAGAMGVPFLPTKSFLGSDYLQYNKNIKTMQDPYTGETVALVPAARPDVALVHCTRADRRGNGQIFGFSANAENAVRAARYTVLTCEKLVDTDVICASPSQTIIPGYCVDAVVETPYACHPWNCPYEYAYDIPFHTKQVQAFKTREGFLAWLEEWCFAPGNWEGYLKKVGYDRLFRLSQIEKRFNAISV
jgi:glutaconate CoA-transferase subunit A